MRRRAARQSGLKRVVRRSLERVPSRRARLIELWNEPWLRGEGAPPPPLRARRSLLIAAEGARLFSGTISANAEVETPSAHAHTNGYDVNGWAHGVDGDSQSLELESEEDADPGMLLDEEPYSSVASQELEPDSL